MKTRKTFTAPTGSKRAGTIRMFGHDVIGIGASVGANRTENLALSPTNAISAN